MKKINLKNIKLFKKPLKSSWQKGIFFAVLVSLVIFVLAVAYQLIKSPSQEIVDTVEKEISSSNINFDLKTIEELKKRQQPTEATLPTVGKNPFLPF